MTLCTVTYDPVSGSNTAASGSGTTVVSGTNGDATAAGTTLTLNETKDISAALDDGTDVLFVEGVTGERHLFRISSFTGGKATCTAVVTVEAFDSTIAAENWSVGGKRKTPYVHVTNVDFLDGKAGWDFRLESGATYVWPSGTGFTNIIEGDETDGPVRILTAVGHSVLIEQPNASATLRFNTAGRLHVGGDNRDDILTFRATGASSSVKGLCHAGGHYCTAYIQHAVMDGNDVGITSEGYQIQASLFVNVKFMKARAGASGWWLSGNRSVVAFHGCSFVDNANSGFENSTNSSSNNSVTLNGCRSSGNGADGYRTRVDIAATLISITSCIADGNTGSGVSLYNDPETPHTIVVFVRNCILSKNGAYGIDVGSSASDAGGSSVLIEDYNAFWDNTLGETNGFTQGANDVTCSVSPYVDWAGGDYHINATAGGGALLRGVGFEPS